MQPNFYKISQENLDINLKYFYAINKTIKYNQQCLSKFKKCTNDYSENISQILKEGENFLNDYEIIDSDYIALESNDTKNNFFLLSIDKSTERLNSFFVELIKHLNVFIRELDLHIKGIEQYIKISKDEIKTIKENYQNQKDIFLSRYLEYQKLNEELKNKYSEGEKKLIEFCHERRLDGITYDNNIKISFANLVEEQNQIIDKYNLLGDFENIFLDSANEKIKSIQDFSVSLISKYLSISKSLKVIFKETILLPMTKLIEETINSKQDEELEEKLKKDLTSLFDSYLNNIDEKNIKLKLDLYNVKVLENNNIDINENLNINVDEKKVKNNKVKKKEKKHEKTDDKNKFINNSNEILTLTEEEIYFIVNNMYQEYKLINRDKYDLDIEEKKLEIKRIIIKLLSYSEKNEINKIENKNNEIQSEDSSNNEKNEVTNEEIDYLCKEMEYEEYRKYFLIKINNFRAKGYLDMPNKIESDNKNNEIKSEDSNNNEKNEVTNEEIDYLCKEMEYEEYRKYFLIKINNFRAKGYLDMPNKIFNYLSKIFSEIAKHLISNKENDENNFFIKDFICSRLVIILSQTFYTTKNEKKVFLSEEIKKEKVFQIPEFWKELINEMIIRECNSVFESKKELNIIDDENRTKKIKDEIYFAQIIPFIGSMTGFGISKEEIKNIMLFFIKEFGISEKNSKIILDTIDCQK